MVSTIMTDNYKLEEAIEEQATVSGFKWLCIVILPLAGLSLLWNIYDDYKTAERLDQFLNQLSENQEQFNRRLDCLEGVSDQKLNEGLSCQQSQQTEDKTDNLVRENSVVVGYLSNTSELTNNSDQTVVIDINPKESDTEASLSQPDLLFSCKTGTYRDKGLDEGQLFILFDVGEPLGTKCLGTIRIDPTEKSSPRCIISIEVTDFDSENRDGVHISSSDTLQHPYKYNHNVHLKWKGETIYNSSNDNNLVFCHIGLARLTAEIGSALTVDR